MKSILGRPISLVIGLLGILMVLAVACGSDEEPAATNAPGGGGSTAASGTQAPSGPKLGGAGIAKNPRTVRGLDAWTGLTQSLDDGLAVWKTRPAGETRTGVTKDKIKLGQSALITGPQAGWELCNGPISQAILKRINEAGGIHGRSIEFIKYDSGQNPTVDLQNIKKLVQQDNIFATFWSENTVGHQASAAFIREQKLLELQAIDNDLPFMEPPWPYYAAQIGTASFIGQGSYADYIKQNIPDAKVALLTGDITYYRNNAGIFKERAAKIGLNIVDEVLLPITQMDPTSQVQEAITSGANVLYANVGTPQQPAMLRALRQTLGNKTIKAFNTGWPAKDQPEELYDGSIQASYYKTGDTNPDLPLWHQMEKLASEENARYCLSNAATVANATEFLVRGLEAAGPDLTREGLLEALQYAYDNYMCTLCVSPIYLSYVDNMAFENTQFYRIETGGKRTPLGQPLNFETSLGKGVRGNDPKYGCTVPDDIKALSLPNYPSTLCPWKKP